MTKIPPEAFDYYFSLGPGRSYSAVAEKYGVTKRAVTNVAKRETWQLRLLEVEAKAREGADKRNAQTLEAAHERRLKSLRLVQGKAIETLRQMPLESAMDAVRALVLSIKQESVLLGEPGDLSAVIVVDSIRREYERWMVVAVDEPAGEPGEG